MIFLLFQLPCLVKTVFNVNWTFFKYVQITTVTSERSLCGQYKCLCFSLSMEIIIFLVLNMLITIIFDYKIPMYTFQIHILIFIVIVTHPVRLSEFPPKLVFPLYVPQKTFTSFCFYSRVKY